MQSTIVFKVLVLNGILEFTILVLEPVNVYDNPDKLKVKRI